MVGTILPVVYGERGGVKSGMSVAIWHTTGNLFGGAMLGIGLGGLGALVSRHVPQEWVEPYLVISAAVGLLVLAEMERRERTLWFLQSSWQVPRRWRGELPTSMFAFLFGLLLGIGVLTRISSTAFYAVVVGLVAMGNPAWGAAVGIAYGFGRALPVLMMSANAADYRQALRHTEELRLWQPILRVVTVWTLAFSAGWIIGLSHVSARV